MIAPWEDAAAIQRQRPADVPPDKARVTTLPDGRAILKREGEVPVVLDIDDSGGLLRAANVLP